MGDDVAVADFPDGEQRFAVCNTQWREREFKDKLDAEVSESVSKSLEKKLEDHREKVGDDKRKQTSLRDLKIVYNRGIGAYRSNPSSVRPSVSSPEQWAQARVNSFLYALRNLRYRSGKHDTDLLPKEHPMATEEMGLDDHRRYEDGEPIPSELPAKYRKSRSGGKTGGQACINCKFYDEDNADHRFYCTKFKAPIRPQYWCAAWQAGENVELAETYNDYPMEASENAKKVLRWRDEHGDEVKGMTIVGWRRANQLAKREKISRETIARMSSFKRHEKNAEINPEFKSTPWKDAGYVAWLGWGGTSGIEWASRKLKQIDKVAASNMEQKFAFGIQGIDDSKVDREAGTMKGVSLISVGAALGHGLFVDQTSLETIDEELDDTNLPAYITHRGALFEDRLTREIGMFSNFRIEGERLLGDFQAFDSFREDDSRKFNRLFEMADKMPERFGLSIVFSATSVWATPEGDIEADAKPDNALFDFPSIRVEEVSSADFVDSPAANQRGLFSKIDKPTITKMTKAQLTEKVDELHSEKDQLSEQIEKLENELDQHEEQEDKMNSLALENQALQAEVEALKLQIEEIMKENEEMKEKLGGHDEEMEEKEEVAAALRSEVETSEKNVTALNTEVAKLKALISGSKPISTNDEDEYVPSVSNRAKIIAEYAAENGISEFSATLRLGKERPEIFKL